MTETNSVEYVLGFAFEAVRSRHTGEPEAPYIVYLIEKNKPEWQKGHLNGIGGKVEKDETPHQAMVREFREEAGLHVASVRWKYRGDMYFPNGAKVHLFTSLLREDERPFTAEVEIVRPIRLVDLKSMKTIPNLKWIIPMLLDDDLEGLHVCR